MENDSFSRRDLLRGAVKGGAALVGAAGATLVSGPVTAGIEAIILKDPEKEESYSNVVFEPGKDVTDGIREPQMVFPKTTDLAQERQEKIFAEREEIERVMEANPSLFNEKKIKDVGIYYPIYKPIADKYNIDWYLIFVVHEAETGASAGKRGFAKDSKYLGAMQLSKKYYNQDYINKAAQGLSFLANLPQRHPDDWMNIAAGAKILSNNIKAHKDLPRDKAIEHALAAYVSSEEGGANRFRTYKSYRKIFSQLEESQAITRGAVPVLF